MNGGSRSLAIVAGVWLATAVSVRGETLVTIGGGGSSRTDCLLVLQAAANDPPDRPKKVTCIDGDPSCDHDGAVNGVCEFQVAACANSTFNPDRCTPTGVASVTVDHAVDNASDLKFDTEFQALQSRIDTKFELPTETQDLCTSPTLVHVALQGPFPSGARAASAGARRRRSRSSRCRPSSRGSSPRTPTSSSSPASPDRRLRPEPARRPHPATRR